MLDYFNNIFFIKIRRKRFRVFFQASEYLGSPSIRQISSKWYMCTGSSGTGVSDNFYFENILGYMLASRNMQPGKEVDSDSLASLPYRD